VNQGSGSEGQSADSLYTMRYGDRDSLCLKGGGEHEPICDR
jgi:hypothetical protein